MPTDNNPLAIIFSKIIINTPNKQAVSHFNCIGGGEDEIKLKLFICSCILMFVTSQKSIKTMISSLWGLIKFFLYHHQDFWIWMCSSKALTVTINVYL